MSKKITVLIDGGHLRSYLKRAGLEKVGLSCPLATEELPSWSLFRGQTWPSADFSIYLPPLKKPVVN